MLADTDLSVCVMGLGYIGLPTAAVIARTGAMVLGVDVTPHVVDTVNSGKVHIEEVDLDALVSGLVARGTLRASTQIASADVFVIAVPTPLRRRSPARYRLCAEGGNQRRGGAEARRYGDSRIDLARWHDRAGSRPAGGTAPRSGDAGT